MKIAILGAGALGGYFGGRLLQAGMDVWFIARGAQLEALQRDGLRIESPLGDAHLHSVNATDDAVTIGPVDTVLFLVKLYDTESAAQALAPLLDANTSVVTLQNGVDGHRQLGAVVGTERVLAGLAYIFADVRVPGVIRHAGKLARIEFGELDGSRSARAIQLLQMLHTAGIDALQVDNVQVRLWEKFVLLSALSGVYRARHPYRWGSVSD